MLILEQTLLEKAQKTLNNHFKNMVFSDIQYKNPFNNALFKDLSIIELKDVVWNDSPFEIYQTIYPFMDMTIEDCFDLNINEFVRPMTTIDQNWVNSVAFMLKIKEIFVQRFDNSWKEFLKQEYSFKELQNGNLTVLLYDEDVDTEVSLEYDKDFLLVPTLKSFSIPKKTYVSFDDFSLSDVKKINGIDYDSDPWNTKYEEFCSLEDNTILEVTVSNHSQISLYEKILSLNEDKKLKI